MEVEIEDLENNMTKLNEFILSERFKFVEKDQQSLLLVQRDAMQTYMTCLTQRLLNL